MRKFTADYILNEAGNLVENHFLVVDDNGTIIDLVQGSDPDASYHEGILSPGFINAHCHMELSHLKNQIPPKTGLQGFIKSFVQARKSFTEGIAAAIDEANTTMWESGIQGTGDICNTSDTFQAKKNSRMRYHSFMELFSLRSEDITKVFDAGENLLNQATHLKLSASLVPHAPYSVPPELFALIRKYNEINNSPWSIHNQETVSENAMFKSGTGDLFDGFLSMGIDMKWFSVPGKNSLIAISDYFPEKSNLLFVHNTFTSEEDILFLKNSGDFNRSWFCLCAKANLFIENKLPDIMMLHNSGCKISIGTDSLASNDTLSVLEEIKTIHQYVPEIAVETLLNWASRNGADYFRWNDLGQFRKGTKPGVIQISGANNREIKHEASAHRLI